MNCVQLHQTIIQITSLYYRLGFWHKGEEPTVQETRLKIFFSIYYILYPVSLISGALKTDNKDESILLVEVAIMALVAWLKLFYIIWKQKQILELLNRICVYSIKDHDDFTFVNKTLKTFNKFVYFLLVPTFFAIIIAVLIIPFIGCEKKLFLAIGFPLDWKNNAMAYWIAFAFFATQMFLTSIIFLFSVVMWYLLMNCGVKYDVLGNQIKKMGKIKLIETTGRQRKIAKLEKEKKFLEDLIGEVEFHRRIREETQQMESFFSLIFLAQLATSGFCICVSIYSIIFSISENIMEYVIYVIGLFYNTFELFMLMYFSNEINSSSDRLTYCVFESKWVNQAQSIKKCLIIFAEILQQPYVLVVGKLYPLTLETFTRILNSAYSMFNILKNFK